MLTKTLPSLAVAPVTVCLLPSIKTNVDDKPIPLKLIFDVPWVLPEVKASVLFSDPELIDRFFIISDAKKAPILSISSRRIISTEEVSFLKLVFIYDPVTTISSTTSCCANENCDRHKEVVNKKNL